MTDVKDNLVYHLLAYCNMLDEKINELETEINRLTTQKSQIDDSGCLLHEDNDGTLGGHVITGVSGGADYVGDFETGFPRELTMARYENFKLTAAYYHESVVSDLKVKLDSARNSAALLKSAIEDRF